MLFLQFLSNILLSWEITSLVVFLFTGISLGRALDKMMWAVGNLLSAALIIALALCSQFSAVSRVVILVHAFKTTYSDPSYLHSSTSFCTSPIEAPDLAKTLVVFPGRIFAHLSYYTSNC